MTTPPPGTLEALQHAAREVTSAVQDVGINPNYHRHQLQRLQSEWPTLYYALRNLERVTPESDSRP